MWNGTFMRSLVLGGLAVLLVGVGMAETISEDGEADRPSGLATADVSPPISSVQDDTLEPYTETIPEILVEIEMVPVPGGSVTVESPEGPSEESVDPFWIAATEVRWDSYDPYRLDEDLEGIEATEADAISLPSKPYGFGNKIPGFGQEGHPAMAVTRKAAQEYARWLSAKTGHTYRLPTPAEWKHACRLGHGSREEWSEEQLSKWAWYAANAGGDAHPAGSRTPSELGVYDQLGNAAEHVRPWSDEAEHPPEVWGGSYRHEADETHCSARRQKTPAWQQSDPQLPKSQWWLSDAPFVGFRLVRTP